MKIGVIGAGNVGAATVMAVTLRSFAREIVVVDKNKARAKAVALDAQYGAALSCNVRIYAGEYADLTAADFIIITAGVNEKDGGATNKADPAGRLNLLKTNVGVYQDIVPQVVLVAPKAVILVATDPPDPLADLARKLAPNNIVLSTGTSLDSLRFRYYVAEQLQVNPLSVEALVVGEHGTSEVLLWSSVTLGGEPLLEVLKTKQLQLADFQHAVEQKVRYANIDIISGNNASQYGIGMVCAWIAQIVLQDQRIIFPMGVYQPEFGVTLSLPGVIGREGVSQVFMPKMSEVERTALQQSAEVLKKAQQDFI